MDEDKIIERKDIRYRMKEIQKRINLITLCEKEERNTEMNNEETQVIIRYYITECNQLEKRINAL